MADNALVKRTVLTVWGQIQVEAFKPKTPPINTVNDSLICGVELEIENLPRGQGWYLDRTHPGWNVVEDGSLRPRGEAWEFVSSPMTLNVMIPEVARVFKACEIREDRNYSDRCSVHVHTNVQDFTQEQIASLALVYPVFEEVLFHFVNTYKKKEEQGYCRDTNLYCIPWSACRMNRGFVEKLFENPTFTHHTWQKYTALNMLPISSKGTVEWRHMHGTCDMDKLTTWFNIIGAIMRYAKETPFERIVETIKTMNDVSTYKQLFEEVLRGSLTYSEEYRKLLREGIVNAKHSYLNWEANKDKPKSKKKTVLDLYAEGLHDEMPIGQWAEGVNAGERIMPRERDRFRFNAARNPAAEVALDQVAVGDRFAQFAAWDPEAPPPQQVQAPDPARAAVAEQLRQAAERLQARVDERAVRRPARPAPVRR